MISFLPGTPSAADLVEMDEAERSRLAEFRQARRHSRRVRFLRYALPTATVLASLLVGLFAWLDPLRLYRDLPLDFGKLSLTDNKLTMEAPKLTGYTRDQRAYSVTADAASQDLSQPNLVELRKIYGQVEARNRKGSTELEASRGLYDIKGEVLHLSGGIEIRSTGGYRATLNEATLQVRKGHIVSKGGVRAVFPDGDLSAKHFEAFDHGALAVFDGGVVMHMLLPPPETAATAAR